MSVHGSAKYFCDQCDFKATLKIYITKHKKSAHGTAAFSSQQSEFIATQKSYNKRHEKSVHEAIKYYCDQCDYKTHVISVNTELNFKVISRVI